MPDIAFGTLKAQVLHVSVQSWCKCLHACLHAGPSLCLCLPNKLSVSTYPSFYTSVSVHTYIQANRQADTERQTGRRADRQTDRHTGRQTDRHDARIQVCIEAFPLGQCLQCRRLWARATSLSLPGLTLARLTILPLIAWRHLSCNCPWASGATCSCASPPY